MAVRYLVTDTFSIPRRGPVLAGILVAGRVQNGDTLTVEATGAAVRISFVDLHTRPTPEGLLVGLELDPSEPSQVTAGTVLVSPPAA